MNISRVQIHGALKARSHPAGCMHERQKEKKKENYTKKLKRQERAIIHQQPGNVSGDMCSVQCAVVAV